MDFADDPEKLNMLISAGREFELDGEKHWFAIAEDGSCALFDKDYKIDDLSKVKTITNEMIRKDITSISIPDSVESIGEAAFYYCKYLKNINITGSIESIGDFAFSWCKSFKHIDIPHSAKSIGNHAFYWCESLESIIIPDLVKSIGKYAFANCESLKSVSISDSVKSIGNGAFAGCKSLKSINIPDYVESIGEAAFFNCEYLEEVVFKGRTLDEVRSMKYYPWGIEDEWGIEKKSIIKAEL